MFWRKSAQVKHLLELLQIEEAWKIEDEPVWAMRPGQKFFPNDPGKGFRHPGIKRDVFTLIDGDFKFFHTVKRGTMHFPTKYDISFPKEYNIQLTNSEKKAILSAVRKFFNARLAREDREKRAAFLGKLLK